MKNFLLFFTKRSVRYFIFACLFYLLFLVVGFNVVNYFSPENSKSLENILTISGVIFTGVLAFIKERENEQSSKLYVEKIQSCQDFFKILEEIIADNVIKPSDLDKDEMKKIFFAISKLRMHFEEEKTFHIIENCTDIVESLGEIKKNETTGHAKLVQALLGIAKIFKEDLQGLDISDKKENLDVGKNIAQGIGELVGALLNGNPEFNNATKDDESSKIKNNENVSLPVWHVNVGEESGIKLDNQYRCWEDMKNFGFWSAGGGKRYADGVKKLKKDDIIYAYISRQGYVAKGIVDIETPILIGEFFEQNEIKEKLKTVSIKSNSFKTHLYDKTFEGFHDENIGEYAVKVKWELTKDGKPFYDSDLKISPLTICSMNPSNLDKLEKIFNKIS